MVICAAWSHLALAKKLDRFSAINSGNGIVAKNLQTRKDDVSDQFFIFDYENGFPPANTVGRQGLCLKYIHDLNRLGLNLLRRRKQNSYSGSLTNLALHHYRAMVTLDYANHPGHTKASPPEFG